MRKNVSWIAILPLGFGLVMGGGCGGGGASSSGSSADPVPLSVIRANLDRVRDGVAASNQAGAPTPELVKAAQDLGNLVPGGTSAARTAQSVNPQRDAFLADVDKLLYPTPLPINPAPVPVISDADLLAAEQAIAAATAAAQSNPLLAAPPSGARTSQSADGLYCSQLPWLTCSQATDLDSNDWRYLAWFTLHNPWGFLLVQSAWEAVTPDELRASDKIDWFYDQKNG